MIYPSDFESKVGFDAVRASITELCLSVMGRRQAESMRFSSSLPEVERELRSVFEMLSIIESGGELPVDGMHDVAPSLAGMRAEGSFISALQLYHLQTFLETLEKVGKFVGQTDDDGNPLYPWLSQSLHGLSPFPEISREIGRVVNRFGEVKDTASPELGAIRRQIASASAGISSAMKRAIANAVSAGVLEKDATPTMRDGRLVVPVESSKKRAMQGIVHDESASGKTSFIEPWEVVEASNRLRELEIEEHREVVAVLRTMADMLRPRIDEIIVSSNLMGVYDFLRAKALYAREIGGTLPRICKKPLMEWYHAVHPVLLTTLKSQGKQAVAMNIQLDGKRRILIISGPNAGGKSVALKTIGIVQYMMQCGVLPPLYDNSLMGMFSSIFIDIGDEQSMTEDLSTYSSHLRNMRHFLRYANGSTLILADEMGSGTEPQIGGALAQAILQKLNRENKCFGVITTHYQNLKTLADNEDGFLNGAMLYDRQHLQPLFELSIGNPGSSFALEIAKKSALPEDVIEAAKEIVGSDYVNMDKYMLDIARDRRYWANKRLAIKEKEKRIDSVLSSYEEKAEELKSRRSEILKEARDQANELLSATNAKIENTIHEIRKIEAEKQQTKELRKELEDYKKKVASAETKEEVPTLLRTPHKHAKSKKTEKKTVFPAASPSKEVETGDYVRMSKGGVVGKVLSIKGSQAEVAFGALRTRVDVGKLIPASKPKEKAGSGIQTLGNATIEASRKRQLNFKPEIDVRGMRADEALQAVAYFIDDAIQFNIGRVRILHGTGTGALRVAIRNYLGSTAGVASFADEDVRFGGAGITVVNLD